MDLDALYDRMQTLKPEGWTTDEAAFAADRYIDAWGSRASAHQYRTLFALVARHVSAGGHVLDWGSGAGRLSFCLVASGFSVEGIDLVAPTSIDVIEAEAGKDRYRFTRASEHDPVRLPYPDGVFDAVVSAGVLEHVRETGGDERASLAEIRRVLRPGGVFICAHLPNHGTWIERVARGFKGTYVHPYRYRRRDIDALLDDADLELLERGRYGMVPRNPFSSLGESARQSRGVARTVDAVDRAAALVASPLAQNWAFVAREST